MAAVHPKKKGTLAGLAALAAGLGILPAARANHAESVAVAAGADQYYVQQRFSGNGAAPKAQSYVFAQGSYFGGYLRDPSLERTQFTEIAQVLAPALARQRFYPAADKVNADLLIVVHWGMTSVQEDPTHGQLEMEKLMGDLATYNAAIAKSGFADPSFVNSDLDFAGAKAASGSPDNAQLLGYASEFQKEEYRSLAMPSGMTEMDYKLRMDLKNERYFVILMAFDYGSVKGGKHGAKPKLLWSTHFSMRATGSNFTTALPAMSEVAARYFGRSVDGLIRDTRKVPEGNVEIGEPEEVNEAKPKQAPVSSPVEHQ